MLDELDAVLSSNYEAKNRKLRQMAGGIRHQSRGIVTEFCENAPKMQDAAPDATNEGRQSEKAVDEQMKKPTGTEEGLKLEGKTDGTTK
jgi:hypothetical protein